VKTDIADALKKIAELKMRTQTKTIEIDDCSNICKDCGIMMNVRDIGYVCTGCGKNGELIETTETSIQIAISNSCTAPNIYSASNGRFDSLTDASNNTYQHTFARLQARCKRSGVHIPLDVLRETAKAYADLCQRSQDLKTGNNRQRHTLIIHSLLQNQLDMRGMSKTESYICAFSGIEKTKLTRSKNKLQSFIRDGTITHVHPHNRIPNFVYLFLCNLNIPTSYTDVAVAIIQRADCQVDMIKYRTCQDHSKVVGTIWVLILQLNMKISHATVTEKCEGISKSTYMRYVEFIYVNRRRLNPILVKNRIRPIPISFAQTKIGKDSRTLADVPERYKGMFIGW
jgi:hypothetical protein